MSTIVKGPATDADAAAVPNPALQRTLVFVVALLGLLIVAGLTAVIGRVIYLSSQGAVQQHQGAAEPNVAGSSAPRWKVVLPQGAVVKSTALSDNRLAVHYDAPAGAGVVIVDLGTGATTAEVGFGQQPAAK